ncbi:High mobility group protein 20A [Echinococcus multilocularis]|uniref:High mobility group protein 20A n=1 Tax=Echinococcus multilocularis TaxID=6211 RepID=A0A087VXX1_ECHMU|nr:High mobility group protein 20A [Echinococcus multilocularis]
MRSSGPNAPPKPSSAFTLYMRHRCSQSNDLISRPFNERRRIISSEWSSLSQEQKQIYYKQAIVERTKYEEEFAEYKKTDEYKDWLAKQEHNKSLSRKKNGKSSSKEPHEDFDSFEDEYSSKFRRIPIFTHEFLEYNRERETSLRHIRKQVTKLDEETALLSKHIDNLAGAETNLEQQIKLAEATLASEESILAKLNKELVVTFSDLPVPNPDVSARSPNKGVERINPNNIESYLSRLAELTSSGHHEALKAKARDRLKAAVQCGTLSVCSI